MVSDARGNGTLWFAISGGPIAWSVDALAAIAIDHDYCAHGAHVPIATSGGGVASALVAISIVTATLAVLAGVTGWRRLRMAGPDTGLGDTDDDRRRFMARFAVITSMLSLFGIVLRMVTVLFVSAAAC
jgi:hypothetical protein